MKILSVFDGMSCGQIALIVGGHTIDKYYASELDKFAIKQTQYNFPSTIQLGDVKNVKAKDLDKIDLFIGGSPCQGFSFAGKQLNFDDPRSALFFEYVRIWNEIKKINPDAKFLLENVNMKKQHLRVISEYLRVFPVRINSNLVSAQNRDRWYWTNIKVKETGLFSELWSDIPQPEDKGIFLKDILQPESEVDEKYYLSEKAIERSARKEYSKPKVNPEKTGALNTGNNSSKLCLDSGTTLIGIDPNGKAPTQRSSSGRCLDNDHNYQIIKLDKQGDKKADQDKAGCLTGGGHSGGNHSDMDIICVVQKGRGFNKGGIHKDKTPTLSSNSWEQNNTLKQGYTLRRLTPIECSRLQTIPDWYKWTVSDTQIYKMLGNGWTVDIVAHIFSFINKP